MKKHRVLIDLSIAMNNGYCGIANENRLIFKMLSSTDAIQKDGLLMSANLESVFSRYRSPRSKEECLAQANQFFHEALYHEPLLKTKLLKKLRFAKHFFLNKNKFNLFKIDPHFRDTIWRNIFSKSLGPDARAFILESDFSYSDLTSSHIGSAAYFKKKLYLATPNHDFAIFLEPTPISVSPNTIKIVRYHDAIPLTEPDFTGTISSKRVLHSFLMSTQDAYFVCNSEPTRTVLLTLKPELESKAFTIPAAITNHYKPVHDPHTLKQIIVTRLSNQVINGDQLKALRQQINENNCFDYIFNLAAFDPKKNLISLVRAWEKLNYQHQPQIKLIIAANKGWLSEEISKIILPHLELGNIIHLDHLTVNELSYLFSHAKAFVFPSYTEGFGLPPLEAMQCGCPTLVSDIPAHRWVLGEAALYCNPYDVDSMTEALTRLLFSVEAESCKNRLIEKGYKRAKIYLTDALVDQWNGLFDKIKLRT